MHNINYYKKYLQEDLDGIPKSTERSRRKRRAAGAHVVLHVSSDSDESEVSIYHFITLKNNFENVFSSGLNLLIISRFRACD